MAYRIGNVVGMIRMFNVLRVVRCSSSGIDRLKYYFVVYGDVGSF